MLQDLTDTLTRNQYYARIHSILRHFWFISNIVSYNHIPPSSQCLFRIMSSRRGEEFSQSKITSQSVILGEPSSNSSTSAGQTRRRSLPPPLKSSRPQTSGIINVPSKRQNINHGADQTQTTMGLLATRARQGHFGKARLVIILTLLAVHPTPFVFLAIFAQPNTQQEDGVGEKKLLFDVCIPCGRSTGKKSSAHFANEDRCTSIARFSIQYWLLLGWQGCRIVLNTIKFAERYRRCGERKIWYDFDIILYDFDTIRCDIIF
jgi:hypothetical protein